MSIEVKQNGQYVNLILWKPSVGIFASENDTFEATLKFDQPRELVGKAYKNPDGTMSEPSKSYAFQVLLHSLNGKTVEKELSFIANKADRSDKFGKTLADALSAFGAGTRFKATYKPKPGKKSPMRIWVVETVDATQVVSPPKPISGPEPTNAEIVDSLVKMSAGKKHAMKDISYTLSQPPISITDDERIAEIYGEYAKRMK